MKDQPVTMNKDKNRPETHMWQEHGLREKKCFMVDLFLNWQMMMCRLRIQKLKIGRLGDFEKIEFENFTL